MNVLCIRVPSTSRRWALIMIANIVNHVMFPIVNYVKQTIINVPFVKMDMEE